MECVDFLQFQNALKRMRDLDDKLVYALNSQLPTPSFQSKIDPTTSCKSLYSQLVKNYEEREASIKGCIQVSNSRIKELKDESESSSDAAKLLSKEQTKVFKQNLQRMRIKMRNVIRRLNKNLRLLKSELNVEEVVKDRSLKLYYERCREYFKPSNIVL